MESIPLPIRIIFDIFYGTLLFLTIIVAAVAVNEASIWLNENYHVPDFINYGMLGFEIFIFVVDLVISSCHILFTARLNINEMRRMK